MATNDFLKFNESDTNMLDLAAYTADLMRQDGFPFGSKPPSNLTNRFYRDTAAFVYAFGEYMKDQGLDASPDNIPALIANMALATPAALSLLAAINTVDGPGSGLNADLFDDKQSDNFVYGTNVYGTNVSTNADLIEKSGFYVMASPYTNCPTATAYTLLHMGYTANTYGMQIATIRTGGLCLMYVRQKDNGSWSSWARLWNADNDDVLIGIGTALPATSGTMTATMDGTMKTITPTGACTFNASVGVATQRCTFVITTSGASSYTLTFGSNFRSNGTLATGTVTAKKFAIDFIYDGSVWIETGRTPAL